MSGHANAPLTPSGRRRLCERVDAGRPISHVAAEAGISRRCLAKWYACWVEHGEDGAREWAYVRAYASEHERRAALADFLNHYNHERPHAALGGRPPITRTSGSDYRVVSDQPPEPLEVLPQQLAFEDFVEPTS